jgi:lipopolysaccharide transport system permease protein
MASYLRAIWHCRFFWLSLVKMDLRTRYRRSVLGLGWSLLHPIAMTTILCTVFHRLFHADVREYGPFVMAGLVYWNYVVGSTLQGCQCLLQGESYIRQYPAPAAVYPLRTTLGMMVHFLPALGVVLALTGCAKGFSNPAALLSLIPTLVLLFLLGWSLAVLAGFANVFFQDIQHLCEIAFQILFYATPILYEVKTLEANGLGWLIRCNPFEVFLRLIREPILSGHVPDLGTYLGAGVVVSVAVAAAAIVLARFQRRFIFYL